MTSNIVGTILWIKYLEKQRSKIQPQKYASSCINNIVSFSIMACLQKTRLLTNIVKCHILKSWIAHIYCAIDDLAPSSTKVEERVHQDRELLTFFHWKIHFQWETGWLNEMRLSILLKLGKIFHGWIHSRWLIPDEVTNVKVSPSCWFSW